MYVEASKLVNKASLGNYQGCSYFHSLCVEREEVCSPRMGKVEPSYFIATSMGDNVTRKGISLIPQDLAFTQTKNYENPHIATLELHPISERALE
jgi:hypothetical protein